MRREFIYETASFPSCHAPTIVETSAGLAAAWFGGTREGSPDVGIWMARHEGGQWTAPVEVANGVESADKRYPCWNPVLFQSRAGAGSAESTPPLMLFYKVGPSPQLWWGMLRTSVDGGKTWSEARRLPDGILGPIKNKPVQLSGGELVCPTSSESPERPSKWRAYFERTGDLGKTWTKTEFVNDGLNPRAIQPAILLLGGERLMALGRTGQGRVFRTTSADCGKTWSPMELSELPNPNSGLDAVTLQDGRHVLVYNHTPKGRSPLNVAVSKDGTHWDAAAVLENEPGEYSYPAVIQTRDGLVHVTYTWKRQRVRHCVLDPGKFAGKAIVDGVWPQ